MLKLLCSLCIRLVKFVTSQVIFDRFKLQQENLMISSYRIRLCTTFEEFTAWSMFYFAAASFSEMSRRLYGDTWSRGFLLSQDQRFVAAMQAGLKAGL